MKQKNFGLNAKYAFNYYHALKRNNVKNVHCGKNYKTGHWVVSWEA